MVNSLLYVAFSYVQLVFPQQFVDQWCSLCR